ncbi:MAG: KH domain-containing protein [Bacilli bacterium]|nr:KH domain-containing protein [Bacilli bacterium]
MNLIDYTTFLVSSIVKNAELVKVSSFGSDEGNTILEVIVSDEDKSKVIGKNGVTIKAIKTMVQAYAYIHDLGKVNINVDSF